MDYGASGGFFMGVQCAFFPPSLAGEEEFFSERLVSPQRLRAGGSELQNLGGGDEM